MVDKENEKKKSTSLRSFFVCLSCGRELLLINLLFSAKKEEKPRNKIISVFGISFIPCYNVM